MNWLKSYWETSRVGQREKEDHWTGYHGMERNIILVIEGQGNKWAGFSGSKDEIDW